MQISPNQDTKLLNSEEQLGVTETKIINSALLFNDANVIYIQHQNGLYQLRETKSGKLILTK
ncbi:hemin uptake protein HemP [Thorsellia anophelis]|uniref:Hemin uptake protein hemP n=1 Tax=Thorsellia anophelis DSM 18579 TaxID=1123402 RepID=A0A1I0EDK2_9GAMM|nr:hemin uptake protein HemP [Thorsellia anophelis]SET43388.1 Hemin uptake protein hemP [Thorsellia anophelis DSM 18579]